MCLDRTIEKKKLSKVARDNLKAGIGYKAFKIRNDKLHAMCRDNYTYKKNKWMHDKEKDRLSFDGLGIITNETNSI